MLLIYVAIGIIAAVITGWFVYQNLMEYWETQARSAFRVALGKELQKRNEVDVYFSSSGNIRLPDDSIDIKKEPIKVEMESEYGKKDFFVPYEKYFHNVEQSSNLRTTATTPFRGFRSAIWPSSSAVWRRAPAWH